MNSIVFQKKQLPYFFLIPLVLGPFFLFLLALGSITFEAIGDHSWTPLLEQDWLKDSILLSLQISLGSAAGGTAIGLILCWWLYRYRTAEQARPWLQIGVAAPHLIVAVTYALLLSSGGILSRALGLLGFISLPSDAPFLPRDPHGLAVILAYWVKEIPFVVFITLPLLQGPFEKWVEASATLGASPFEQFTKIFLPRVALTTWGIFLLVFSFSFGSFEIPYLLGPSQPLVVPLLAWESYLSPIENENSIGILLAVVQLAVIIFCLAAFVVTLVLSKNRHWPSNSKKWSWPSYNKNTGGRG